MGLVKFVGALLAWGTGLLLLWLLVDDLFVRAYAAVVDTCLGSLGGNRALHVEVLDQKRAWIDAELRLYHADHPERFLAVPSSSYMIAYLPAAVLFALVVATPLAWRLRLRILVVGELLLVPIALTRIGVAVAREFTWIQVNSERLLEVGPTAYRLLNGLSDPLYRDPNTTFLAPGVLACLLLAPHASELLGALRRRRRDAVAGRDLREP